MNRTPSTDHIRNLADTLRGTVTIIPASSATALLLLLLILLGGCGREAREHNHAADGDGAGYATGSYEAQASRGATGDSRHSAPHSGHSQPGGCTLEFSYAIGTIDPRFRISRNEVRQAVEQALDLWAGAVDRLDVRFHEGARAGEQARNTIHFDYDERQEQSDRARRFQDQIASKGEFIDQMHREYERDQRELKRRTAEHRRLSDRLNGEIGRFNAWTESVNEAGGFREEELSAYEERLEVVETLRTQEREMRSEIERFVAAINRSADRINREVAFHDDMIRQFYNEFGGESRFKSAVYRFDRDRGTITVYHFHNRRELKVILAHEIGHALGLGHVPDSRSIMYDTIRDQMLGREITLSDEDIRAVQALCR